MKLRHLGYACINMSLDKTTNKTFRLSNLNREKYIETVSYNLKSIEDIIKWNADNGIHFFRIGSELIPFASHSAFQFDWKKDFEKEFKKLSVKAKKMLKLENDDKLFNISDVLEICKESKIPAVFDILHHDCNPAGGDLNGLLSEVVMTWGDFVPKFHISSRKGEKGCPHADYIVPADFLRFKKILDGLPFDKEYDIMIEAKMKDKAVLRIMEEDHA